jgi:hypothetical protein
MLQITKMTMEGIQKIYLWCMYNSLKNIPKSQNVKMICGV